METTVKRYLVELIHDNGTAQIELTATSEERAIAIILITERCPRRCITNIQEMPL
jgi:hypothetical protein